ncbi:MULTISPECIES: LOG family protein [Burkholderia]|uniref:LOG family protein n=1 Tax=Burkholderia TaxID=32008 RepID=UPI000B7A849E|nr:MULTISPECIES: TIGR00730 family Rossman fold protein [Burkholderia]OXI95010.1 Rossman fold protein, TIGR00730 family [Burkholderia sp. AU33803]PRD91005.1 TIGR00730 family Rossman fold protein [Burkholderia contaminans]
MTRSPLFKRRIGVFAGSSVGNDLRYAEQVREFIANAVSTGLEVVYGGGSVGLMGVVADTALNNAGKVVGVIPQSLANAEVAHRSLTALHVVESMSARKRLILDLSDYIVAFPGGIGTVEELFEAWSELILGLSRKPVFLLNISNYWSPLLRLIEHMAESGFIRDVERGTLIPITRFDQLLSHASNWTAPPARWAREMSEDGIRPT